MLPIVTGLVLKARLHWQTWLMSTPTAAISEVQFKGFGVERVSTPTKPIDSKYTTLIP